MRLNADMVIDGQSASRILEVREGDVATGGKFVKATILAIDPSSGKPKSLVGIGGSIDEAHADCEEQWRSAFAPVATLQSKDVESLVDLRTPETAVSSTLAVVKGRHEQKPSSRPWLWVLALGVIGTLIVAGLNYEQLQMMLKSTNDGTDLSRLTERELCQAALTSSQSGWDEDQKYVHHIAEAKRRQLTISKCRAALATGVGIDNPVSRLELPDLCRSALNAAKDDWDSGTQFAAHVAEARRRGATVAQCRNTLGLPDPEVEKVRNLSIEDLCRAALNSSGEGWDDDQQYRLHVLEAQRRNLSVRRCKSAVGDDGLSRNERELREMSPSDLCEKALNRLQTGWDTGSSYAKYVREAHRRNMTVRECRSEVGATDATPDVPASPPTPDYSPSLGWSWDHPSRAAAEAGALSRCKGRCRVAIWFGNSCGAVAVGQKGGWATYAHQNSQVAQAQAIAACNRLGATNCYVIRWQCSSPGYGAIAITSD